MTFYGGDGQSPPKYPRVTTWYIGPHAVDYNGLMWRLEREDRQLVWLTPKYGWFGRLKGFVAFVTYEVHEFDLCINDKPCNKCEKIDDQDNCGL